MPDLEVVGTTKAAELLNVSPGRIRQLIATGQLPAVRIGKTYVVRLADIKAFLAQPPGRPRHPRRARADDG